MAYGYLRLLSDQLVKVVLSQLHDRGPQDVLHKVRQLLRVVGALVAVRPALVEEDGSGVGVDAVLVADPVVNRAVHSTEVDGAANQGAGLQNRKNYSRSA